MRPQSILISSRHTLFKQNEYTAIKKLSENVCFLEGWLKLCRDNLSLFINRNDTKYQRALQLHILFTEIKRNYSEQFLAHRQELQIPVLTANNIFRTLKYKQTQLRVELRCLMKEQYAEIDYTIYAGIFLRQMWFKSHYVEFADLAINNLETASQGFLRQVPGLNTKLEPEQLAFAVIISSLSFLAVDCYFFKEGYVSIYLLTLVAKALAKESDKFEKCLQHFNVNEITYASYRSMLQTFIEFYLYIGFTSLWHGLQTTRILASIMHLLLIKFFLDLYLKARHYFFPAINHNVNFLDMMIINIVIKNLNYLEQRLINYFTTPVDIQQQQLTREQASQILQVAPDATTAEIQYKWRQLARQLHPDKNGGQTLSKLYQARQAYDVLLSKVPAVTFFKTSFICNTFSSTHYDENNEIVLKS